jgi:hypothetical protein
MAAPTHPYLPASFPFAKGKEEPSPPKRYSFPPRTADRGRLAEKWFPRARGNLKEGALSAAIVGFSHHRTA